MRVGREEGKGRKGFNTLGDITYLTGKRKVSREGKASEKCVRWGDS